MVVVSLSFSPSRTSSFNDFDMMSGPDDDLKDLSEGNVVVVYRVVKRCCLLEVKRLTLLALAPFARG
jgi:hypothetical protein